MAFYDGSLLDTLPVHRVNLMQVDSVQRWMDDLMLMTECECMCILQSKPISVEDDAQSDLMLSSQDGAPSSLELLLRRAWIISTELTKIVQKLEKNRWMRVHTMTMKTNCHVHSMIKEYNAYARSSTSHMHQLESLLMDKCAELAEITERCTQTDEEEELTVMKFAINEALKAVGQHFSQLINLSLVEEVKGLVEQLDAADSVPSVERAIRSLVSLTQEGTRLCHLVSQEGAVIGLFKVLRQDELQCLYPMALRTLASLCCLEEGVLQLDKGNPVQPKNSSMDYFQKDEPTTTRKLCATKELIEGLLPENCAIVNKPGTLRKLEVDGILCLTEILTDGDQSEVTKAEVAAVIAQITSPHLTFTQHLSSFLENMEEIVTALLKLCEDSTSGETCLLACAALANITFFDSLACEMILQMSAVKILLSACMDKQRVATAYARDQIATVLANLSILDQCAPEILQENGVEILIQMLWEKPISGSLAEVSACERVLQKSAITLARLSRHSGIVQAAIQHEGIPRLIALCRHPEERYSSDAVLVACLSALRRLAALYPEEMEDSDLQQLVRPRLVDSFLLCSNMEESFV